MPQFNPDFWEIPVPPTYFHRFCNEDQLWYDPPGLREQRYEREDRKQKVMTHIRKIIDEELTAIQRHCVMLYFFHGRTQEQIAATLGISRRVVSQHLFGVKRKGKRVGGAINKIRKVCVKRGVSL